MSANGAASTARSVHGVDWSNTPEAQIQGDEKLPQCRDWATKDIVNLELERFNLYNAELSDLEAVVLKAGEEIAAMQNKVNSKRTMFTARAMTAVFDQLMAKNQGMRLWREFLKKCELVYDCKRTVLTVDMRVWRNATRLSLLEDRTVEAIYDYYSERYRNHHLPIALALAVEKAGTYFSFVGSDMTRDPLCCVDLRPAPPR